jgi:hypothetical protein
MNLQAHVTSLNGEDLNLFLRVLRLVYQKGSSYYSENDEIVRGIMLIFNHMLESAMFRGQSVIALALHQFAFSLVAHDECPVSNPRVVKLEQGLLSVEAMRARPEDINARTFTSRNGDTVSLPNSLVKRNTGFSIRVCDLLALSICLLVCPMVHYRPVFLSVQRFLAVRQFHISTPVCCKKTLTESQGTHA